MNEVQEQFKLEQLLPGTLVRGLAGEGAVEIISSRPLGSEAFQVYYKDARGGLLETLLYREDETRLEREEADPTLRFSADAEKMRLASEAQRIRLAHLFDPYLALSSSQVEALPHQITAVYGEMLRRQPLRFLLADDPGAGKTVMAGLLIRELMSRGELERLLIVAPGGLVEQWQDELAQKFGLELPILDAGRVQASRTGNPFAEEARLICRMDMLSRNDDLMALLEREEWDLVVVDEAHRMSVTVSGEEIRPTRRYRLGQLLSKQTRNFLLMSATPHNGKDAEFEGFMALLDPERFEGGGSRSSGERPEVSDLMRRMLKEDLVRFDETRLFPERRSFTVGYTLSQPEQALYQAVTTYVREEMGRAERLDPNKRVNISFALQILQRRLASSPEAILRSLTRRRERLELKLKGESLFGLETEVLVDAEDLDDDSLDELGGEELEQLEAQIGGNASAARTLSELKEEIATLRRLERQAHTLRLSEQDTKWRQLCGLLEDPLMVRGGKRRQLIIFSEARDTLNYLVERIGNFLGRPDKVEVIHGGLSREQRRAVVERFRYGGDLEVLVANDAAGEGLNLQSAHLMVNYDLPWNPNRLEQRFGRIHRIGQKEVCFLWNLVAQGTREGEVYHRLLEKLDIASRTLGGRVFDVLGQRFENKPLRELLMEAVLHGESEETRIRLEQTLEGVVDLNALRALLEDKALVRDSLDLSKVQAVRADMERAQTRKLQPHFISSFFAAAFEDEAVGGRLSRREPGRYAVTHVPSRLREGARRRGRGEVLRQYERITFDKTLVEMGEKNALLIYPGQALLEATLDLILEQYGGTLAQGTILIDPHTSLLEPRLLAYLEHEIRSGLPSRDKPYTIVSRKMQFVELTRSDEIWEAGHAPYLDYTAPTPQQLEQTQTLLREDWLRRDPKGRILEFAVEKVLPQHLEEVRQGRLSYLSKVRREVESRMRREINYWDSKAHEFAAQEKRGKQLRVNSQKARERADDLQARLERRIKELDLERQLHPVSPQLLGLALVVPLALLEPALERQQLVDLERRRLVENLAMRATWEAEEDLGYKVRDVSLERGLGYDLESSDPRSGRLRFIEVKGVSGDTVTLTKNEILAARNTPEQFRLSLVQIQGESALEPRYLSEFEFAEPSFGETARSFSVRDLLERAREVH